MTTLASAVGRILAEHGVDRAFGVTGNGNILAVAALTAAGTEYVAARHEGGAIAMADAHYRTTGEVALCTTTVGPGFTNTATGLADAAKHRSGVLVLTGDAPASGIRRIDIDQAAFAASLGVRTVRITCLGTARAESVRALELARRERCPVVLALPQDLLAAEVPDPPAPGPPAAAEDRVPDPPGLDRSRLEPVLDVLAAARRPLLLAGLGAWRSGAGKPLRELGDRLGALFATTMMGAGIFADSPWSLGICGGFSAPGAAELIRSADAVLAFGAGLNEWTLHGGRLIGGDAVVVRVDTAPGEPGRADLTLTGDAAEAAGALLDGCSARGLPASAWRDRADLDRLVWADEPYRDAGTAGRIDPRTLARGLAPLLPEERTLVLDGGHFVGWPAMYWTVPDPAAMVFTGAAFQSIGLGFAGAVGAAVGRADRTTVVALGDGGALMGLPELDTLVRSGRSALAVVFDDAAYGAEIHLYGPLGADTRTATFEDTDFAAIARALGASAATVRATADLAAVRDWNESGRPGVLLLDCKVVPEVVAPYLAEIGEVVRGAAPRP